MIEMLGICKDYNMGDNVVHALDHIDFAIADREFVSIIGPSGSGKSTLMNIIGCLDLADEGVYRLAGQEITDYTENELAAIRNKKIGFIFQQFNLLPRMTAQENVELPLIYTGMRAGKRHRISEEVLERVGLADRMDHRPAELSGGQQQRVAIARALVTSPSMILADEPTGNLDSRTGQEILQMLRDLHRAGNTIVLITHDPEVAAQTPRHIRLHDGRVVHDSSQANQAAEVV